MSISRNKISHEDIVELFEQGTIVIFKCEPTESFPIAFVSKNVEEVLGFPHSHFTDNKYGWSERIHPDDQDAVAEKFMQVLNNGGSAINEYRFRRKDGKQIWLRDEIKVQPDENGEPNAILGTSFEITDRKISELQAHREKESELRNRLDYQYTLAKCSNQLVENNSLEVLQNVLNILLSTTGTDRSYIFFNSTDNNEALYLSQRFEACKEGVEPQIDNPELQNMPYTEFPYFHNYLKENNIINERVSNLPSPEKDLLEAQDIEAILLLPIFVGDDWFGFIGFDSVGCHREWEDYELITLKTTVDLIGTFLKRLSVKELLIQQKNFTQQVLDNLPSIVALVDKKMNLLRWNETGERLTGYSPDELKKMTAFDLVSEDDRPKLLEAVKQIYSNNSYGREIYLKHKKGFKSPYYWRASIIEMEGQEVYLIIGMNISKQKEMEKELLHEKRFADAIIDGLPGTFFMLDEDLNLVRCNKNLAQDLGYSVDEMLNNSILDRYSEEGREKIKVGLEKLFENGFANMETNPISRDGDALYRNVNAVIFERDGEKFIIGTGQDISDLKMREKELRATLKEKQVLLQEIHHRVKNNLAVISGLLELQANEYSDPKFHRLITESQMRIKTMAMIHEKLYQSHNISRIAFKYYIDQLIEQINESISYGNTEIIFDLDIEDIELNINQAVPFALALNEIISNALEHAFQDREKGTLYIEMKEKNEEISTIVKDDGVGFSNENNIEDMPTLGTTLIRSLMQQIEADWSVAGQDGVTYKISFKKDASKGSSSTLDDI